LDALGDLHLALAGEQGDRAHLAQVHAHRIVGFGVCVLLLLLRLFLRGRLIFLLHHYRFRLGRLRLGKLDLVGLVDDGDVVVAEHRHHVVDLVGGDDVRRQRVVDLVVGEEALVAPECEQVLHFLALGGLAALLGRREILVFVLFDVRRDLVVVAYVGNGGGFDLRLFALRDLFPFRLVVALRRLLRLLRRLVLLSPLHLRGRRLRLAHGLQVLLRLRRSLLLALAPLRLGFGGAVLAAGGCGLLVGHLGQLQCASAVGGSVESNGRYACPPFFFRSFQALGTRGEARCFRSSATVCACFFKRLDRRLASVWSPACSISARASSTRCRNESGSTARSAVWASCPEQTASAASRSAGCTKSPTPPE